MQEEGGVGWSGEERWAPEEVVGGRQADTGLCSSIHLPSELGMSQARQLAEAQFTDKINGRRLRFQQLAILLICQ